MNSNIVSIFSIISSFQINKISIQRIQMSIVLVFAITKYKVQNSTFDKIILDFKIRFERENDINFHKFCFLYVQLFRLRTFFNLHILESLKIKDLTHVSNLELITEFNKLHELQSKILKK